MDVEVIIEVPQGSRKKYEMDPASGRVRLDRMLFTSTRYPVDYGFIPGTLAEDGDPLDAMVLLGEPAFPGCHVTGRPVGVFWMSDEHGPDAKILTVPARDPRYEQVRDLADVPTHLLAEISHFFDVYKELEPGKDTDVRGWQGLAAAEQEISASTVRARGSAAPGGISGGIPARARRAADQPAPSSGNPSSLRQSRRPVPPSPATASWAFTLRSSCSRLASSASSASARSADCSRSVAAVSSAAASRPVLSE